MLSKYFHTLEGFNTIHWVETVLEETETDYTAFYVLKKDDIAFFSFFKVLGEERKKLNLY